MKKVRLKQEYTSHSLAVSALMSMYSDLEDESFGQFRSASPIAVFMAFSVEAYLNHLGAEVIKYWDGIERLPWKKKVEILHLEAEKEPNWGEGPLQFTKELFTFRDRMAHGKKEEDNTVYSQFYDISQKEEIIAGSWNQTPLWFRKIDRNWAMSAKPKFTETMTYLGNLFGKHESNHLNISNGSYEYTDKG